MRNDGGLALVAEVASLLAKHGSLKCIPAVDEGNDRFTLTLTLAPATVGESLDGLELYNALRRLQDVCQMRRLSARYDIPSEKLEALLPPEDKP